MNKWMAVIFLVALGSVAAVFPVNGLRVDVPFDFMVRDRVLPAGEYTIQMVADRLTAQIRNVDGEGVALANTFKSQRSSIPEVVSTWVPGPVSGSDSTGALTNIPPLKTGSLENCVVFHKYGDRYFISGVWLGLEGREFLESSSERSVRTGSIAQKPETVVLAGIRY